MPCGRKGSTPITRQRETLHAIFACVISDASHHIIRVESAQGWGEPERVAAASAAAARRAARSRAGRQDQAKSIRGIGQQPVHSRGTTGSESRYRTAVH